MVIKETVRYPAFTGEEDRTLYICLPPEYRKHPERRYPVLYMFDGHNVFYNKDATFGKSWGMLQFLRRSGLQLIVAALECNKRTVGVSADDARVQEYSPFDFTVPGKWMEDGRDRRFAGYGGDTLRWFAETLKPELDRRFRTLPGRESTWLAGSSMGGLMSIYGLTKYNAVFSKACAFSPALEFWQPQLEEYLSGVTLAGPTELYMDYGTCEEDYAERRPGLVRLAGMLSDMGVLLTCRTVPGGIHNERTWERQLPFALGMLTYGVD